MASGTELRSTSMESSSCSREALAVGMAPRSSSALTTCWWDLRAMGLCVYRYMSEFWFCVGVEFPQETQ